MDADGDLRRLRSLNRRLEEDNADLRERLAYAWQEVARLRAMVIAAKAPLQTAPPAEPHATVVPVTRLPAPGR
jgi:cell division septum initiation protein DivIVA